jgi:transcriptional regulator with XRE-family HTH domain
VTVTAIREIRLAMGCSQRAFAERLDIPLQTYCPLDSSRRTVSSDVLERAAHILEAHRHQTELVTLDVVSAEFKIHPRTLRAAARDGRLDVHLSNRSVFGRPLRLASRSAVRAFVERYYRQRYSRFAPPLDPPRVSLVPANCASRILELRLRLRMSQAELARRIGAANKAVVYQWESSKRTPSIVYWRRIEMLLISIG